jgi:Family of unknown function (DUF6151)
MAPHPTNLPFSFVSKCQCGKVSASILTLAEAPPLRLVCYCKDCRGYFETLNRQAESGVSDAKKKVVPPARLDNWGGVDWTALYPRDITIVEGKDHLTTVRIREKSNVRQVYATCCNTPMFRFGEMSVLLNSSSIVPADNQDNGETVKSFSSLPVTFRIIGRDSWKTGRLETSKPSISSSVPLKWFWTMPFRIRKAYMEPMPMDVPKAENCKVLHDFHEGSTKSDAV